MNKRPLLIPQGTSSYFANNLADVQRVTMRRCLRTLQQSTDPAKLVFSHVTALQLLGVPVPALARLSTKELHVSATSAGQRPRPTLVYPHVWTHGDTPFPLFEGTTCATPVTAWAQMSRYLNLNQLVTVADSMMCGNADLAWLAPEDFKDYLDTHRWFQGRSKCLRALTLMEAKTDSPQETYLRLYLQASGITPLLVNPVVRGWNKTWKVDLVHPPSRCIFEYDGRFHNSDSQQWARDPEKRQDLEHADWRVFNITSQMLSVPEKKNELTSSIMATIVERMSSTLNR